MINQKEQKNQLPKEIQPAFKELKVLQHLRNAGFKKRFGFTCSYLFQIIFVLIFHHKNWFQLLESVRGEDFPGKDAVYRFLNHAGYAWRRFLLALSADTVKKVRSLTSSERVTVFIVDDSMYERNRSKSVELLARFKDHAKGCYYKGFRMLTLGWSDGHTFIPVDFSLLSSVWTVPRGARASAIIYSIVETAKENGLNPFYYLSYLFGKLPNIDTKDENALDNLLPWSDSIPSYCRVKK
jgi:hypothetical protein